MLAYTLYFENGGDESSIALINDASRYLKSSEFREHGITRDNERTINLVPLHPLIPTRFLLLHPKSSVITPRSNPLPQLQILILPLPTPMKMSLMIKMSLPRRFRRVKVNKLIPCTHKRYLTRIRGVGGSSNMDSRQHILPYTYSLCISFSQYRQERSLQQFHRDMWYYTINFSLRLWHPNSRCGALQPRNVSPQTPIAIRGVLTDTLGF